MGLRDVRLAALLGASPGTLGWQAVLWSDLLYALAAAEALTRLTLRRQPDLAFGPHLLAGAFLSVALVGPGLCRRNGRRAGAVCDLAAPAPVSLVPGLAVA